MASIDSHKHKFLNLSFLACSLKTPRENSISLHEILGSISNSPQNNTHKTVAGVTEVPLPNSSNLSPPSSQRELERKAFSQSVTYILEARSPVCHTQTPGTLQNMLISYSVLGANWLELSMAGMSLTSET